MTMAPKGRLIVKGTLVPLQEPGRSNMAEFKTIIASGPVIIEKGKLLVNKDNKDDFFKIPGGKPLVGESLEETCIREVQEEINGKIEIIKPLSPMVLWKNPTTDENVMIVLMHYLTKLKNKSSLKAGKGIVEMKWLDIKEIKEGKHNVAPNIKFLIEKGDIK
jgi:ADP-ribose pyrophosphatase YjhB (NUDIX family)